MKRMLLCLLAGVLAGTLFAADTKKDETSGTADKKKTEKSESGEHKRPDMQTLTGMAEMLKQTLTLTDEQYKKVKDLAEKGQNELDAKSVELKKFVEPLEAERAKDAPDMAKVKDGMEKRAKMASEIEFLRFKFNVDCKPILTAEQVEKWKEMRKKLEERMKSAREKHKEK